MSLIRTVTTTRSVSPMSGRSVLSLAARPLGSSRDSVSPCSSRSTMAWCKARSRCSALSLPADTPWASVTNTASTSAATACGGTCRIAAMALMVRPAAIRPSSSSSAGVRPPPGTTGATSASTMAGSRAVPPVATVRMASTSWLPSATRSLSR